MIYILMFLDYYMTVTYTSQIRVKSVGNYILLYFAFLLSFICCQLIYLKITSLLFPTSDFWHPVVTPAFIYMSQLLTKVCL